MKPIAVYLAESLENIVCGDDELLIYNAADELRRLEAVNKELRLKLAEQPAREPTKAMIDAAERIDWSDSDVRGNIVNMWQAMCAVAPQAPKGTPDRI